MPAQQGITYRSVETIDMKTCSKRELSERFLEPGIPCLIENLYHDSPAHQKWSKDYFKRELGETPILYHDLAADKVTITMGENLVETHLADFLERIDRGELIKHVGLAHPLNDFVTTHPSLKTDVRLETLEEVLPPREFLGLKRLDARFWPWLPPYPPHFFIAGAGTMAQGHHDRDHSDIFHWCVWGEKSVRLFAFEDWAYPSPLWGLFKLHHDHLSSPTDPKILEAYPRLDGLQGWSTKVKAGQTIFIPSKMFHHFKNTESSLSYTVRARCVDSLDSYLYFAADGNNPTYMIGPYAALWRKMDRRQRTLIGNLMAYAERPLLFLTRLVLRALNLWSSLRPSSEQKLPRLLP